MEDLTLKEFYHLSCALSSCFFNALLSALIVFKSPKQLGKYKYLMLYTALFEAIYAILDYFLASSYGYAWFVIRLKSGMSPSISQLVLITWCGMFGVSQAIFAAHFLYRYAAINKNVYEQYLGGKKLLAMFIISILMGLNDGLVTHFCFAASEENREYLRNFTLDYFSEPIEDTSFIAAKFYHIDANDSITLNWIVWLGVLNLWTMVLASMFCVFYFGLKTYRLLQCQLEMLDVQSKVSVNLQHQLFRALVAQTTIPFVFMYFPSTFLFSTAIFNMGVGDVASLISYTITLYPVVDPLPTIFIIKSYRDAVKDFFMCRRCYADGEHESAQNVSETVL